jgi:hypothetical protein
MLTPTPGDQRDTESGMREQAQKFVDTHANDIRQRAPSLKPDADLTALIGDVIQWLVHDEQAEEYEREHMRASITLKTRDKSEPLANKYVELDAARKLAFEATKKYWGWEMPDGYVRAIQEFEALCQLIRPRQRFVAPS